MNQFPCWKNQRRPAFVVFWCTAYVVFWCWFWLFFFQQGWKIPSKLPKKSFLSSFCNKCKNTTLVENTCTSTTVVFAVLGGLEGSWPPVLRRRQVLPHFSHPAASAAAVLNFRQLPEVLTHSWPRVKTLLMSVCVFSYILTYCIFKVQLNNLPVRKVKILCRIIFGDQRERKWHATKVPGQVSDRGRSGLNGELTAKLPRNVPSETSNLWYVF